MRASGTPGSPQVIVMMRAPSDEAFSAAVRSSGVLPESEKMMTSSCFFTWLVISCMMAGSLFSKTLNPRIWSFSANSCATCSERPRESR